LLSIKSFETSGYLYACCILAGASQLCVMLLEAIKISQPGVRLNHFYRREGDQIKLRWFNVSNCLGFISTLTYLSLRMYYEATVKSFVICATVNQGDDEPNANYKENLTVNTVMTLTCLASTALATWRLMFFLQMYRSFGQLVELVRVCLGRMVVFMGFMFIWIFYFAFSYFVLGSEIDGGDDFSVVASDCLGLSPEEQKLNPNC